MRRLRYNPVTGSAASLTGAPYYTDPVVIDNNTVHVNGDQTVTAEEPAAEALRPPKTRSFNRSTSSA
jgi:hypothetical protein